MRIKPRVYHTISLHSQKDGRWSYTDPPLATIPPDLRDIYGPDEGWPWLEWDWSQVELRLHAAYAKDLTFLDAMAPVVYPYTLPEFLTPHRRKEERLAIGESLRELWQGLSGLPISNGHGTILQQLVSQFEAGDYRAFQAWPGVSSGKAMWEAYLRAPTSGSSAPWGDCSPHQREQARQYAKQLGQDDTRRACALACAAWVARGDQPISDEGQDIHLKAACECFGLPLPPTLLDPFKAPENRDWLAKYRFDRGKEDPRRHFGKTMQHRLCKGGLPEGAGSIPGAKQLGLKKEDLVRAANAWLAAHPAIAIYHQKARAEILQRGETRTWAGRRRRYLGESKYIPNEALAHPDQAGTQDLANAVILEIKDTFGGDVYYVKGNHDSQTWGIKAVRWAEIEPGIKQIAQQARRVNGLDVPFPATFKRRRDE